MVNDVRNVTYPTTKARLKGWPRLCVRGLLAIADPRTSVSKTAYD